MLSVGFPELEDTLAETGSLAEAAEAHGSLCGALCAESRFSLESWLDELVKDPAQVNAWRGVFETVYSETRQALGGEAMQFEPLLPDDDQPLCRSHAGARLVVPGVPVRARHEWRAFRRGAARRRR